MKEVSNIGGYKAESHAVAMTIQITDMQQNQKTIFYHTDH